MVLRRGWIKARKCGSGTNWQTVSYQVIDVHTAEILSAFWYPLIANRKAGWLWNYASHFYGVWNLILSVHVVDCYFFPSGFLPSTLNYRLDNQVAQSLRPHYQKRAVVKPRRTNYLQNAKENWQQMGGDCKISTWEVCARLDFVSLLPHACCSSQNQSRLFTSK